ncbi:MAG: GDSL-type esterase/lipase family protein [Lachnospiraceae bacterium]
MSDNNSRIKINRWVRMWNRHKTSILMLGLVLLIGLVVLLTLQLINKPSNSGNKPTEVIQNGSGNASTQESSTSKLVNPDDVTNASTQPTTQAQESTQAPTTSGNVLKVTTKAGKEAYSSSDFYANAVFVGDGIASGVSAYKFLTDAQYIGNVNMSTLTASSYVDTVVSASPSKIFINMGINDLNSNTRTASQIATTYSTFVASLKSKLPAARIYVVSVLPVGATTVAKNVTNARIKELNDNLIAMCNNLGVKYIDINGAFADDQGNLNSQISANGLNIASAYYPYFLNTIAKVAQ